MTTDNDNTSSFLTLPSTLEHVIDGAKLATLELLKRDLATQVILMFLLVLWGSFFTEQATTVRQALFGSVYYIASTAFVVLAVLNLRYKQYALPECCRQQAFQWIRAGFLVLLSVMAAAAIVEEMEQSSLVSGKMRIMLGLPIMALFFTTVTLFLEEFFKRLASDEIADFAARRYTLVLTLVFFLFINLVTPITP